MLLGPFSCLRRTLPQDEFTFDAQELGDAPTLLVALRLRERLVDCRKSLCDSPRAGQGFRERRKKCR